MSLPMGSRSATGQVLGAASLGCVGMPPVVPRRERLALPKHSRPCVGVETAVPCSGNW